MNLRPLACLFLMEDQIHSVPAEVLKLQRYEQSRVLFGVPVKIYDSEAALLADFFSECMSDDRVVGYVNTRRELVRSDV